MCKFSPRTTLYRTPYGKSRYLINLWELPRQDRATRQVAMSRALAPMTSPNPAVAVDDDDETKIFRGVEEDDEAEDHRTDPEDEDGDADAMDAEASSIKTESSEVAKETEQMNPAMPLANLLASQMATMAALSPAQFTVFFGS
uniref:RPN2_C domain-containing protein n=1 Tax=Steinernema glaseri TaxID=37863 RepID=A0A1I8A079_9BILA